MQSPHDQPSALKVLLPLLLVLAAALTGLGWYYTSPVLIATALQWLLILVICTGAFFSKGTRTRASRYLPAKRVFSALLPLSMAVGGLLLFRQSAFFTSSEPGELNMLGGGLLLIAVSSAVLVQLFTAYRPPSSPDLRGLIRLIRVGTWLTLVAAASTFSASAGFPSYDAQAILVLALVPGMLSAELLLIGVASFFRSTIVGESFGADLIIGRVLGSSYNPIRSLFIAIHETFGVDIRSSWVLAYLRQVSVPVLALFALGVWGLSSFVVVDASQQAVRERFGKVDAKQVLEPGLVVGLPWPFDRVRRVDVLRTRSLPLGYADAMADADALWTQYHAAEEFNLLLGDGRDLVTINAELLYRVGDVHAWLYGCQNPEEALETLSYRVLMDATVDKTLDEVLSRDIATFSGRMHEQIQQQAQQKGLGVEVVAFNLRGLHPPVAVAEDYQAVVAAQLDRTTYIMDAEAYREVALPVAEAAALTNKFTAEADRAGRLATAKGEAAAFSAVAAEYQSSPELYRFRRQLEALEQVLIEKPHYIIDDRIERDGGAVWILE